MPEQDSLSKVTIKVGGMSCAVCANSIEKALQKKEG
ncbi:MAG: heavy-metal-associated domain-containing protein, partial [Firmicutes bacterium]|nr:heavy-metal-associated domain-containing protein [Bacillota bacterium]